MRNLTKTEIEKLANRKGAKRIAVENFLSTLGGAGSKGGEIANMYADASVYRWNSVTQNAILAGINKAYKGEA